ncbi:MULTISPECIES: DUF3108 domain-containing protein [unclassified Agarivorans]|uniref:DUF3108 domain-containing protein n=1 Tax=unclassified Agarivorans TaxID=2636026 RepID=UPI0026E36F3B|nr:MULTISPECIES: DUF3108 domain-containing protein [unclassified Agarivorans]MDO6687193.1 DUF3108 domain-containing protein [Agarivorans sp. 3_MG-2023]MDO6716880.1 DUF3108 domain-containing protein [Agarivorans sp. 2_MG-2023]
MSLSKAIALSALLISTASLAEVLPFEAEYSANFKGIPIAKGYRQLIDLGNDTYQIKSIGTALAGGLKYDDTSRFTYHEQDVQTLGFVLKQSGLFSTTQVTGHPDRKGGLIVDVDGERHHFEAPEDVHQLMDAAGFSVQLQNDLKKGLTDLDYHYNVIDEVDNYRFTVVAEETVTTNLGTFEALKVEQKKREGRSTWLWLAPELDYHLVKAEIIRNGKSWATLEATRLDIQGLDDQQIVKN